MTAPAEALAPEPAVSPAPEGQLERLFAPEWAGGWAAMRVLFVVAAAWGHLPRVLAVPDVYAAEDMVFTAGIYRLAEYVTFTPTTAYGLWTTATLGLAFVLWGGRLAKPGVILWLFGAGALLAEEALNVKAHDRLLFYLAIGLLLSPVGERGLHAKWRSPAARWYLLVVFCALYGSTGMLKLLYEPGWWDGTALPAHLVHRTFGRGHALAAWVSGQTWITAPMGWWTVAFEVGFPFLVWFRRTNYWVLAAGAAFHLGIFVLMDVGAFSLVAVAAYPALLHPEEARRLWGRVRDRLRPPMRE